MTKNILIAFSLTAAVALSACGKKLESSSKEFTDIGKTGQDDVTKISSPDAKLLAEAARQPGMITFAGVAVDDQGRPDSAITVRAEAGKDARGNAGKVQSINRPRVTRDRDIKQVKDEMKDDKTIVAIGECNAETVQRIASENSFKVIPFVEKTEGDSQDVRANTVLLCGKVAFKRDLVSIVAVHVLMTNVSWTIAGANAFVIFRADELILDSENRIRLENSVKSVLAPSLMMSIAEKVVLNTPAHLDILSLGADMPSEAPKK